MPRTFNPCDGLTMEQKANYIAGAGCPSSQLNNLRFRKIRDRALACLQHTALEAADHVTGCDAPFPPNVSTIIADAP